MHQEYIPGHPGEISSNELIEAEEFEGEEEGEEQRDIHDEEMFDENEMNAEDRFDLKKNSQNESPSLNDLAQDHNSDQQ